MPASAVPPAESFAPAPVSAPTLLPRHEAFARHVSAGRSLAEAARMAGYAWDSARQAGSRLMKDARIAARVADLAHAAEQQRQGELDELVGILKNTILSAAHKKDHFAVLRAADMIARFRNLVPGSTRQWAGPDAGFDTEACFDAEPEPQSDPDPKPAPPADDTPSEPEAAFDPPMPPELRLQSPRPPTSPPRNLNATNTPRRSTP